MAVCFHFKHHQLLLYSLIHVSYNLFTFTCNNTSTPEQSFNLTSNTALLFYFLSEYSVPLERISETQLTLCSPERELLPLVLSHCHYTLRKGGETDSTYDLLGIQTQLARRFLAGKPLIRAVKT